MNASEIQKVRTGHYWITWMTNVAIAAAFFWGLVVLPERHRQARELYTLGSTVTWSGAVYSPAPTRPAMTTEEAMKRLACQQVRDMAQIAGKAAPKGCN